MNREQIGYTPASELKHGSVEIILERYGDSLGPFHAIPIGESGHIIQRQKTKPSTVSDWVFFDYDDTLVATTRVKSQRLQLFTDHLQEDLGIAISDEQIGTIMDATDEFARWEETPGSGNMYHANAHIRALSWIADLLEQSPEIGENSVIALQESLTRIKQQLFDKTRSQMDDPFYFDVEKRKLVAGEDSKWSLEIEKIIDQTMVHPPEFAETIEAAEILRTLDGANGFNLGVFTYGDSAFQLLKIMELMKAHPKMDISQIWLSKVPKGKFIESALRDDSTDRLFELTNRQIPESLKNYLPNQGRGTPLGTAPQAIIFLDDNPKELDSVLGKNSEVSEVSGSEFTSVRSLRSQTREEDKEWGGSDVFVVDMKKEPLTGREVASKINAIRNKVWEERLKKLVRYDPEIEMRTPLRANDTLVLGEFFTVVTRGTNRDHISKELLNEDYVTKLRKYLGTDVTVSESWDAYQFMYEENEEQSHGITTSKGILSSVTREGVKILKVTGIAVEKGIDRPAPFSAKAINIPFGESDFSYRNMARDRKMKRITFSDCTVDFTNDNISFTPNEFSNKE